MRDSPSQVLWSRVLGILAAIVLVIGTAALRWALADELGERAALLIFLPAVAISAYLGGVWAGLTATVLSVLAAELFVRQLLDGQRPLSTGDWVRVGVFLATGTFISLLTEHLRRWRQHAGAMLDAVRRADERYRTFIRQSTEGIWRFELDQPVSTDALVDEQVEAFFAYGYLAECNDAMARMYGFDRAERLIGTRLGTLLVRDDPHNLEYLRSFVRSGYRLSDYESHERDKDGQPRVLLNNLVGVVEEAKLVRVWGTQRDVTEQKSAQERLSLYREIFAHSNDAIAIIDAHGRYIEQNAAHRLLTGYSDDDLQGRTPAIHLGEQTFQRIAQELAISGTWRGETVTHAKPGHEVPVELSAFAVRDAGGAARCYVGIKRDMTARKRAEQRLLAEHAVTRILSEADSIEEAAPQILRAIRDSVRARVGALWLPDAGLEALRCAQTDGDDGDEPVRRFCDLSRTLTLRRGAGLPGQVWESRVPAWVSDVAGDDTLPRGGVAVDTGLRSALAFPIASGDEFFGIMEFFTDHLVEPDPGLLSMMAAIGSEIGQFILRRRAEAQLRRSQRDLAGFVEDATVGLHWIGPDGIILWANQAELNLLGYRREEYIGRHIGEFHMDQAVFEGMMQYLAEGKRLHEFPARLRCKDGSIKDVLIDSSVMWEDGKFVHTRCFTRDVTQQKLAQRALRASAESLRLALEAGQMGTWEWDLAGGGIEWSSSLESILALPPEAPRTLEGLLHNCHPHDRQGVSEQIRRTLTEGADYSMEFRLLLPGAVVRWVEARGKLYRDEAGTPQRVVGVCTDITQRKRYEQERDELLAREQQARAEAERASKAKDQFLAVLSHELRTPLTPVLLTTALLESTEGLPHEVKNDLQTIRRNVELEARLIDDLLDLTRIARGKLQLDLQTCDLHSLLRTAVDICHQNEAVKLELCLSAVRHHVRADPSRLQQVFWNLLNNAHKFTPPGGTISVRSRNTPEGLIRVEVSDTGVGIEPHLLHRIFAAFEQEADTARRFGGLGLGLSISKALVDAQGGRLVALSDGRGKGATFILEMPAVRAFEPASAQAPAPGDGRAERGPQGRGAARTLRILVVEDHEPTRYVMVKLLADLGHEPVPASDVESALRVVQAGPVDLVISDLGLPDGSGHELMRRIRQQHDVRGIALSGYGMDDDVRRSEEAGFAEHLIKPVDLVRLEAAIRRVTHQPVLA